MRFVFQLDIFIRLFSFGLFLLFIIPRRVYFLLHQRLVWLLVIHNLRHLFLLRLRLLIIDNYTALFFLLFFSLLIFFFLICAQLHELLLKVVEHGLELHQLNLQVLIRLVVVGEQIVDGLKN